MLCEGLTEAAFADQVLRPRFESVALLVAIDQKGRDGLTYPRLKRLIQSLLRGDAVVTTMVDLYGLPENYPGHHESQASRNPLERARVIERAIRGRHRIAKIRTVLAGLRIRGALVRRRAGSVEAWPTRSRGGNRHPAELDPVLPDARAH